MLGYDDPKWNEMQGGYKVAYNPTSALKKLEGGTDVQAAWDELWNGLHHQGDVGEASYAAVPHLVRIQKETRRLDWNLYAMVSTIETERHAKNNPPLPPWLEVAYRHAMGDLVACGLEDLRAAEEPIAVRAIIGAVALAKGALMLGALISSLDQSEIEACLDEHLGWSENYR
jgi:hypothetical protein